LHSFFPTCRAPVTNTAPNIVAGILLVFSAGFLCVPPKEKTTVPV